MTSGWPFVSRDAFWTKGMATVRGRVLQAIACGAASLSLAGCPAAPAGPACYGDAQCQSGFVCAASGQCVRNLPIGEADAGADAGLLDAGASDAGHADAGSMDGGPADAGAMDAGLADAGPAIDAGALCPAHDGTITADELTFAAGRVGQYRALPQGTTAPVDLTGTDVDGVLTWDFSAPAMGEVPTEVRTHALSEQWFAADFPDATYAARLSPGADTWGIFRVPDAGGVELVGIASDEPNTTRMTYEPPVQLFELPLSLGTTWEETPTATGVLNGVPFSTVWETYTFEVTREGRAIVPAGTYDVLELRVHRRAQIPFTIFGSRSLRYLYVAPCVGAVATIGSEEDEDDDPLTTAAEYTRLGF